MSGVWYCYMWWWRWFGFAVLCCAMLEESRGYPLLSNDDTILLISVLCMCFLERMRSSSLASEVLVP